MTLLTMRGMVPCCLLVGLIGACQVQEPKRSAPQITLTYEQAVSILRGCCKGAGGKWDAKAMVCAVGGPAPGRTRTAFIACAGRGKPIQFVDLKGQIGHLKGRVQMP